MFAHCSRLPNFTLWKFGKEYSCHHGIITKLTFNLNKKKILTLMFVANSQVQVHLLNLTRVVAQWPALAAGKGSLLLHSWKISASYSHEPWYSEVYTCTIQIKWKENNCETCDMHKKLRKNTIWSLEMLLGQLWSLKFSVCKYPKEYEHAIKLTTLVG